MKWIPLFNYLYTYDPIMYIKTIKENYYYLDTDLPHHDDYVNLLD